MLGSPSSSFFYSQGKSFKEIYHNIYWRNVVVSLSDLSFFKWQVWYTKAPSKALFNEEKVRCPNFNFENCLCLIVIYFVPEI